jgi:eukaryotic-like serine/threonine-protein kinase
MEAGTIIGGRYQLVDRVAEGGLATVWQGVARSTEVFARPVAIKVMKREFTTVGGHYLSMFLEEARIGAQLQHPNLIQVLDFIVEATAAGPVYCLVLEWIDGVDLRTMVQTTSALGYQLPWGLVAHIGVGVLRGLAAAHERRLPDGTVSPVVHRDASPQNILLGANGSIKLADFGMARARDRIAEHTAPGIVKGTLSYIAPEILRGKQPGPACDIYSLGVTMWEALVGDRMFHAPSQPALIEAIRKGDIQPLAERCPDVPPKIAEIVHRALANNPEQRFPSARAMIHDLNDMLNEGGWGDADTLVGNAVIEAQVARKKLVADGKWPS